MSEDPTQQRREVCKALTRVVRHSNLASDIDPKAFFMMLNANYAVLYRDELFDLGPLWEALAGQHSTSELTGLFIRFARTLQERGIRVGMPPQVSDLTPEQQQMHLDALEGKAGPQEVEAEVVALTDELEAIDEDNPPPPMLELGTGDLKPYVDPELRREILQVVISSVRAAPVGARVDGSQLAYLIDNNFDALCDGRTFDMNPVLDGLRDLGNVADRDLYLAVALLGEALREHGIGLRAQRLDVSEAEGRQLIEQYHRDLAQTRRDAKLALTQTGDTTPTTTGELAETPRAEARKTQLRRMGLGRGDERLLKRIRIAVMAIALIAVGGPAYIFRPTRPLTADEYQGTVPLKTAELRGGMFLGALDEEKWWPLSVEERQKRLDRFEAVIRKQGYAPDLQVRDEKNRLVITSVGAGRLRGAPFLMRGRKDGSLLFAPDYADAGDRPPAPPPGSPSPDGEPEGEDEATAPAPSE